MHDNHLNLVSRYSKHYKLRNNVNISEKTFDLVQLNIKEKCFCLGYLKRILDSLMDISRIALNPQSPIKVMKAN